MRQTWLLDFARALNYGKSERLASSTILDDQRLCLTILESSIRNEFSIFFFPGSCFEISPFGSVMRFFSEHRGPPGNYVSAHPELSEKFLRRLFTGLELLAFKLCHIALENQQPAYTFEQQRTIARINRLQGLLGVGNWTEFKDALSEILFVRDSFAHSFIELDEICFRRTPLKDSFGDTYLGASHRAGHVSRVFMDDVDVVLVPIFIAFTEHQMKQLDASKFGALCDRLLKERSLTR